MADVKMRALKVLYTKGSGQVDEGQEFQIESSRGKELAQRGFAELVGAAPEEKTAPAPENKMEPAPENKSIPSKRKAKEE